MAASMRRWKLDAVGRENLTLAQSDVPTPGPHEVLVKVSAVSLNYHDKNVIEGVLPFRGPNLTPGSDMAGVVVGAGHAVTRFKGGERVISTYTPGWYDGEDFGPTRTAVRGPLGDAHPGVLAEFVALDEEWLVAAPTTLDDLQACTLPCAALTAWTAMVEKGRVCAGQTVVSHGTGGVSLFGLQFALAHGAATILTSRSAAKLERARALGIDAVVDTGAVDWVEAVLQATGGRGADHVLETIGGAHVGRSLRAAGRGGRVSLIGVVEGFDFSGSFIDLARKHITLQGIGVGHRRSLTDLVRAMDTTGIQPVIDAVYPFEALSRALDHQAQGPFGKIVLSLSAS